MREPSPAVVVACSALLFLLGVQLVGWPRANALEVPEVSGDQLFFLYDARENRVPFIGVANTGGAMFVDVAFYDRTLTNVVAEEVVELAPTANLIIDPTTFAGGGAIGNAGLVTVTPVSGPSERHPVVPQSPLMGVFTLANLQLGSGFGQNPFARSAVDEAGRRPPAGTRIDGITITYERFTPNVLVIPVYFNPQDLEPPERDGNRVLLAAFEDVYGSPFRLTARTDESTVFFADSTGRLLTSTRLGISGVLLSDLQTLADGIPLQESGKVVIDVNSGSGNTVGLFSQSLGTFAAGQRLPALDVLPIGLGS